MRIVYAALLALGAALLPAQQVAACSCAHAAPAEAAAWSDAVFAGTVIEERAQDGEAVIGAPPGGQVAGVVYTFAVDGVAKGNVGERVEVATSGNDGMCGIAFERDLRWLVFTTLDGGVHHSGLCSGNLVLEAGQPVPFELVEPLAAADSDESELPVPVAVVGASLILVLAASWLAFRRGRVS